jgi:EAL domain-containing protein (putative c-di-GMP-specific phosphodiesterase class I)/putative methionine-R-sulfoxide reductase with GAF domain
VQETLADAIRGLTDPTNVMGRIVDAAMRVVPTADGAVIEMVEGDELVYSCTAGVLAPYAAVRLGMRGSLSGLSIITGSTLRCDDALTDPRVDGAMCARVGALSLLCVPLRRDGRSVGVLKITAGAPHVFSAADATRLAGLADFVATMVATAWEMSKVTELLAGEDEFVADVLQPGIASDHAARARIDAVLEGDTLRPVFQPIVELETGQIHGAEALARFPTPPIQGPDVWFAEAHRVGLGIDLELAAVRRAVEHLPGLPVRRLAINVGPETLADPRLVALLADTDPSRVCLELTEHLSVSDYDRLCRAIAPLRDRGMLLSIDDTGAGFASLAHVVKLDPDVIKLDRDLIDGIERTPGRRAIAAALTGFAAESGAQVVAEGIEDEAQLRVLRELGVRYGQGWLLGRPVPLADFPAGGSIAA